MSEIVLPARLAPYVEALIAAGIYGSDAQEVAVRAVERLVETAIAAGVVDLHGGAALEGQDGRPPVAVAGSIPAGGPLPEVPAPREAHPVEHPIPNRTVEGSTPSGGATPEAPAAEAEQCGSRAAEAVGAAEPGIAERLLAGVCEHRRSRETCRECSPATAPAAQTCHFCSFKTKAGFWWAPGTGEDKVWRCSACETGAQRSASRSCPHEDCKRPLRADNVKGQCAKCTVRGRSVERPVRGTAAAAR